MSGLYGVWPFGESRACPQRHERSGEDDQDSPGIDAVLARFRPAEYRIVDVNVRDDERAKVKRLVERAT